MWAEEGRLMVTRARVTTALVSVTIRSQGDGGHTSGDMVTASGNSSHGEGGSW